MICHIVLLVSPVKYSHYNHTTHIRSLPCFFVTTPLRECTVSSSAQICQSKTVLHCSSSQSGKIWLALRVWTTSVLHLTCFSTVRSHHPRYRKKLQRLLRAMESMIKFVVGTFAIALSQLILCSSALTNPTTLRPLKYSPSSQAFL